jgi:hypothetical protein
MLDIAPTWNASLQFEVGGSWRVSRYRGKAPFSFCCDKQQAAVSILLFVLVIYGRKTCKLKQTGALYSNGCNDESRAWRSNASAGVTWTGTGIAVLLNLGPDCKLGLRAAI